MDVWSWVSIHVASMMSRFSTMVTNYIDRNLPKRKGSNSRSSESPRRGNCVMPVWFFDSM
jgi:hypothetical protein